MGRWTDGHKKEKQVLDVPVSFFGEPLYLSVELYRQEGQIFKWDR